MTKPLDEQLKVFTTTIIIFCFLFVVLMICWVFSHKIPKYENEPVVEVKIITKFVEISPADSLILIKLIKPLKEREGLELRPYKRAGFWYIGFGHQITYSDIQNMFFWKLGLDGIYKMAITPKQAEELLWTDLKAAWAENERIKRKTLYKDCFQIFISGHK